MGKGNRNRENRSFDRPVSPEKRKQRRPMPKWAKTAISLALVAAILCGVVLLILSGNGTFERNRILIESKSGKFDVNQQMATYIAWYEAYQYGVMIHNLYAQMGSNPGMSADEMGLSYAMGTKEDLRTNITNVQDLLLEYVALCDAADAAGMALSQEDHESIDASIKALWALKSLVGYDTVSRNVFLEDFMAPGMRVEDIRAALEMTVLANKYALQVQTDLEASIVTDTTGILLNYRDTNLNKFYKAKYLSYTAETDELVKLLAEAKTAEQFKEIVLKDYFDTNYKGIFNKYTLQVELNKDLASIKGKTDVEASNAWTNAVSKVEGWEKKTYTQASTDLPTGVLEWLFAPARLSYDAVSLLDGGKIYVVTVASVKKEDEKVVSADAYVKAFDAANTSDADALYNAIYDKKDVVAATAWTDAINKVGGFALDTYKKKDSTLPEDVQKWMFSNDRKQFETELIEADGSFYFVAIKKYEKGTEADDITVMAYVKKVDMNSGESFEGDDTFMTTMYTYLKYQLIEKANDEDGKNKPTIKYQTASEKANALKDSLKAENADVEKILEAVAGLIRVDATNKPASIPSEVTSAFKDSTKKGDVLIANNEKTGIYYLIYVDKEKDSETASGFEYRYATFETDLFHTIAAELQTGLSKVMPAEKSVNADTAAEKDTFAAWISELTASGEDKVLPFIRVANEVKMFTEKQEETVEGQDKPKEKTVYSAYFIVEPMKYDTETTKIHGGYIKLTGSSAQADAEALVAKLNGKTYANLIAAFSASGATTSQNAGFDVESINDETVKAWFEAEGRVANEIAIIEGKDGNLYVVAFVERLIGWESDVKTTYVTDTCKAMVADLKKDYVVDQKALEKVPTTEEPEETTSAA